MLVSPLDHYDVLTSDRWTVTDHVAMRLRAVTHGHVTAVTVRTEDTGQQQTTTAYTQRDHTHRPHRHCTVHVNNCCHMSPHSDTSEHTPPNPRQTGQYLIYQPRRDGRLS